MPPPFRRCAQEASTDDITVTYGKASFEEKETGNYILPAGTYDALQINIGRAKGHNWWCMLYPSICFSDALRPVNEDGESAEKVEKAGFRCRIC